MENPILNRDKKTLCKHFCLGDLRKLLEMLWFLLFYFQNILKLYISGNEFCLKTQLKNILEKVVQFSYFEALN